MDLDILAFVELGHFPLLRCHWRRAEIGPQSAADGQHLPTSGAGCQAHFERKLDTAGRLWQFLHMTLHEYLHQTRMRRADFAKIVGVSMGGLSKWLNGQRVPNTQQMKAIVRVTWGAVTPNDFFPECSRDRMTCPYIDPALRKAWVEGFEARRE